MSRALARFRAGAQTESGVKPTLHPLDQVLWAVLSNARVMDGGPQKDVGWVVPYATPGGSFASPIRGMTALRGTDGIQRAFFGNATELYHLNSVNITRLSNAFTGQVNQTSTADATTWDGTPYGEFCLLTNGIDVPQKWSSGGGLQVIGGTPPIANFIKLRTPHVLLFDDYNAYWCDEDNVDYWTAGVGHTAGSLPLRDLPSRLRAVCDLGDSFALYTQSTMRLFSWVGTPIRFGCKKALSGIGSVSKHAVVSAGRMNYGMDFDGFFSTDGTSINRIGMPDLQEYIDLRINKNQLSKVCAQHDSGNTEVSWNLPSAASNEPDYQVVYNYGNKSWRFRDYARSGTVDQKEIFQYPVSADGTSLYMATGVNAGTGALQSIVQSKPMDLSDPWTFKYIDNIAIQVRKLVGVLTLELGVQNELEDAIVWFGPQNLSKGFLRGNFADSYSGKYISIRLISNEVDGDFAMSGFDLYGEPTGADF